MTFTRKLGRSGIEVSALKFGALIKQQMGEINGVLGRGE